MTDNIDRVVHNTSTRVTDFFGAIFNVFSQLFWRFEDYIRSLIRSTEEHTNHHEENDPTAYENDADIVVASDQSANYSGVTKKIKRNPISPSIPMHSIGPFQSNVTNQFRDQPHIQEIVSTIIEGFKVMIILRGPPGTGKSYLAKKIKDATKRDEETNHIFSTDNYFYDADGRYNFSVDHLRDAHVWNNDEVDWSARQGVSPIIVDNTNIRVWEMRNYLKTAVSNGYLVKIVEPQTPWSKSADELTIRNSHNVPKETIKRMMLNYEPITVELAMERFELKYTIQIPQYRKIPPLPLLQTRERDNQKLKINLVSPIYHLPITELPSKLHIHRKNCKNENQSFAQIRQVYPSVSAAFLWNIFDNCRGDGNRAMDILLKNERLNNYYENAECYEHLADLDCDCDSPGLKNTTITVSSFATMKENFKIGDKYMPNDKTSVMNPDKQNKDTIFGLRKGMAWGMNLFSQSGSESIRSSASYDTFFDCESTKQPTKDLLEIELAWPSNKAKVADWISHLPQNLEMSCSEDFEQGQHAAGETYMTNDWRTTSERFQHSDMK